MYIYIWELRIYMIYINVYNIIYDNIKYNI